MKKPDQYKTQILKWTCIGLLIRLVLMPFTMHGQDLIFINYFPLKFIKEGIWDPYSLTSSNSSHFPGSYYGPVLFIIMSIANFIFIKLFNAISLGKILEIPNIMMSRQVTPTAAYISIFPGLDLFKNLFLMKSPYLIFDFLIGAILLKLALSKKLATESYKLWMLNIVVLHSVYMIGQFEVIPAFFIISALFAALKKRPYLSIVLLSLGGATKLFPYILILPASLLLGGNWKKRLLLLFTAGAVSIFTYLPFYLSSGNSVFGCITMSQRAAYPGITTWIMTGIFVVLYSFISINATKDSQAPNPEKKLLYYFIVAMFLSYTTYPIRLRYLVPIMPLLTLIIPQYKKFALFILSIILMLAVLWLPERSLQLGLFAPLNPEYFLNLPSLHEIVGRFVNMEIVYNIMARASLLCLFIATWWIWRIKLNSERQVLKV